MERRNLLYEILLYHEWCLQESEAASTLQTNYNSLLAQITKAGSAASQNLMKGIKEDQIRWQFAVGMKGNIVAVLTDNAIEIRSAKDQFATAVATIPLDAESEASLRIVSWSPDGSLLSYCSSSGAVEVYDIIGTKLYEVFSAKEHYQTSKVACLFSTIRCQSLPWLAEMLLIDFSGSLKGYFVSHEGFQESCSFSFAKYYPGGITAAAHHPTQPGLFVAGLRGDVAQTGSASSFGVSSWRIIDTEPYFEAMQVFDLSVSIFSFVASKFVRPKTTYDAVIQMLPSPNGKRLGVVHFSGAVSLWTLPSLICEKYWVLEEQPGFDELSPALLNLPARKRMKSPVMKNPRKYHPAEINWWSDEHLIIARTSGSVSVCEVATLKNVLGSAPEFLDGTPRISRAYKKGFLAVECEVKSLVRKRTVSGDESAYETYSDESDEEEGVAVRAKKAVRSALYWATDSERFQPPRKKPKFVSKTYRLLQIKSTTPQELFARKLDQEEYGEALLLARNYGLDTDLVFQRQWRNKEVSLVTIKDYLYKVKNRSWVLNECLTRSANDPDSARELLQYGLRISDLDVFVSLADGADSETVSVSQANDDEFEDPNLSHDSVVLLRQQRNEVRRRQLLSKIDFSKVNDQQKLLLSSRKKLLQYSDRLFVYESVLGGPHKASDLFDAKFFFEFRAKTALKAAVDFAHSGDHEALALMLTYNSVETLPHRLALIASIPETLEPFSYRNLLPECDVYGEAFRWETVEIRNPDWCDRDEFIPLLSGTDVERTEIDSEYNSFTSQDCNPSMITAWYVQRAKEIEAKTHLVGNAVDLIRLGVERNVQGLEEIYDELATLETLVYECQLAEGTSLKHLQSVNEREIARLIMSKTTPTTFVHDLHYLLLPYLDRVERNHPGSSLSILKEYLVSSSEESLSLVLLLFEHEGKGDKSNEALIKDPKSLIQLAIECVYACQSPTEIDTAFKIYECLPERGDDDDAEMRKLQDQVDELELVLNAVEQLKKYDVRLSFSEIKKKSENYEESKKILAMLSRQLVKKKSYDENEWRTLLQNMLDLREKMFIEVSPHVCCEFIVESLMSSGNERLMQLAASLIEGTSVVGDQLSNTMTYKVPSTKGQDIALAVAREYIDSAGSVDDQALKQARACLSMFTKPRKDITEELNLLSGIQLLGELGVEILPLQVRLKEERISLVEMAIRARPKNYRNPVKLIRLGQMLCACEGRKHEIEGTVLTLVAEAAVQAVDNLTAVQTCRQISSEGFETGWKVCWKVASKSDIADLQLREDLFNFALVHCDEDCILNILKEKDDLLKEKLGHELRQQLGSQQDFKLPESIETILKEESILSQPNDDISKAVDSKLEGAKTKLVEVASSSASYIISTVSKTDAFIKGVTGLGEQKDASSADTNLESAVIAPAFYEDLWKENLQPSPSEVQYTSFALPKIHNEYLKFFTNLAKYLLISDEALEHQVFEGLLENSYVDNHLQFHALLLCNVDFESVWTVFCKLKATETCLMYAAYQISLRLLAGMDYVELMDTIYRRSFKEVIQRALKLPKSKLKSDELKRGYDLLHECWHLLGDTIQARQLKKLDPNVDAARFATDEQYKKDTIVGLAITTDESIYASALQLAERFGVDVWEVHYGFFSALVMDSELNSSELEAKLKERNLLRELEKEQTKLEERMESSLYQTLSGLDHGRLNLFFTLLQSSENSSRKERAENSIKILKKLKQYKGMDFKKLVSGKEGFIEVTYPVLAADNVNNIIKLAATVSALSSGVTPSSVYAALCSKVIFEGHLKPGRPANSHGEWVSRFDDCKDYLAKLDHSDFRTVIEKICFGRRATEEIPTQTRCDFLNRSLKLIRQLIGKLSKEFKTEEEALWNEIKTTVESWLVHLTVYSSDIAGQLKEDSSLAYYVRSLESSQGDPDKLISVQKEIALTHPRPLDALRSISVLLPPDVGQVPEDLLVEAVKELLSRLRDTKPRSAVLPKLVSQLKSRLLEVKRACDQSDFMVEDDVRTPVEEFLAEKSVPLSTRISAAIVLPKSWQDSPEAKSLLLAGTSLDIVQTTWPEADINQIDETTFSSEDRRYELFASLLGLSKSVVQLRELLVLLKEWPEFTLEKYREAESQPVVLIVEELRRGISGDVEPLVVDIITKLLDDDSPPGVVTRVFHELLHTSRRLALKLALYTSRTDLVSEIVDNSVLSESDYDSNILDLVRRKELEHLFEGTVLEIALKKNDSQVEAKEGPAFLSKWVPSTLGNIATGFWGGRGKK